MTPWLRQSIKRPRGLARPLCFHVHSKAQMGPADEQRPDILSRDNLRADDRNGPVKQQPARF